MANITPTLYLDNGDYRIVTWAAMANGDVGLPVELVGFSDRSVQIIGTFGTGGNAKIEGSNDGTNYVVLSDPQGTALDATTARIKAVSELTRYFRPRISAGDGTTALTVVACLRRSV